MQKKLAFVGCRPERLPFGEDERTASAIRLKALLLNEIMQRVEEGYDTFLTGAMRGGDILFAEQLFSKSADISAHSSDYGCFVQGAGGRLVGDVARTL